jgi:glycosyltransferase
MIDHQPYFSIITVVLNGEKTILNTFRSIRAQTESDFEYLVFDGGSFDGTLDIIRQNNDLISFYGSSTDRGIYFAMNKGLLKARGKWVLFIGADDVLEPDALKNYKEITGQNPDLDFVYGRIEIVDSNGKFIKYKGESYSYSRFKHHMIVNHTGAVMNSLYFKKWGLFNPLFKVSADYELLLRSGEALNAEYIPETVLRMNVNGISHSSFVHHIEDYAIKRHYKYVKKHEAFIDLIWEGFKHIVICVFRFLKIEPLSFFNRSGLYSLKEFVKRKFIYGE